MKFSLSAALVLTLGVGTAAYADESTPDLLKTLDTKEYKILENSEVRGRKYFTNSNPSFHSKRIIQEVCGSRFSGCTGNGWFSSAPYSTANISGYIYTYEVRVGAIVNGRLGTITEFRSY